MHPRLHGQAVALHTLYLIFFQFAKSLRAKSPHLN